MCQLSQIYYVEVHLMKGKLFRSWTEDDEYNSIKAEALGLTSHLVYKEFERNPQAEQDVKSQAQQWGFEQVFFFENSVTEKSKNDAEAIALVDEQKIIIAFRGTESKWQEWIDTNGNFSQTEITEGKVHEGFYQIFSAIWDDYETVQGQKKEGIKNFVKRLNDQSTKQVYLTGHSLGGAMAILTTSALLKESISVSGVYTYGQPRVGNKKFANYLDEKLPHKIYRLVNNNDIVPRIPNVGYEHAVQEMYFDHRGRLSKGSDHNFLQRSWDRLRGRFKDLGKPLSDGVKDHFMSPENPLADKKETYLYLLEKQNANLT